MTAIDLNFIHTASVPIKIVSDGLKTQTTTVGGQTRRTGRNLEQDRAHNGGVPPAAGGPGEGEVLGEELGPRWIGGQGVRGQHQTWSH